MPVLKNPKHERFAQGLAKGKTQIAAYVAAGFKGHDSAAARLFGNVRISERVAEIQERAGSRAEVSKAWVMERLMRNAQMCLGEEPLVIPPKEGEEAHPEYRRDPSAANAALQLLGKELGMFVDRSISATTTLEELLDHIDDGPAGKPEAAEE